MGTNEFSLYEERPVYRTEPIYKPKCTYDTYEWQYARTESTGGGLKEQKEGVLPWPHPLLKAHERAVPQAPRYEVNFQYERKGSENTYNLKSSNEEDFLSWKTGDKAILIYRNLCGVIKVSKEGEK